MLYSLKDILLHGQKLVTVQASDTVAHALDLMAKDEFSQLPIVDPDGRSTGQAITADSILESIRCFQTTAENLRVSDAAIQVKRYGGDADLVEALDDVLKRNFVVVVDAEDRLTGIVTTADTTAHFRRYAEDMMIVEFTEITLKEAARAIYQDENKLRAAAEKATDRGAEIRRRMPSAIAAYLGKSGVANPKPDPACVEQAILKLALPGPRSDFDSLTFDEIKEVLLAHEAPPKLAGAKDQTELRRLLEMVRGIRNQLAHFRGPLTATERKSLRFAASWLERHLPTSPPEPASKLQPVKSDAEVIVRPVEEPVRAGESIYAPLAVFLEGQPGGVDQVKMSFEQVEGILGVSLPKSAYEYRAWWANAAEKPHAAQWLDSGWRAQFINLTERRLTFARIAAREDAYIRFYSDVKRKLQANKEFPLSSVSPQGQCWQILAELPWLGSGSACLNASFTRHKQLRVEVYLDCGDREKNKTKFDQLLASREALEGSVAAKLAWERMEERRASRVALYRDGHILQDKPTLQNLAEWLVNEALRFHETFLPLFEASETHRTGV